MLKGRSPIPSLLSSDYFSAAPRGNEYLTLGATLDSLACGFSPGDREATPFPAPTVDMQEGETGSGRSVFGRVCHSGNFHATRHCRCQGEHTIYIHGAMLRGKWGQIIDLKMNRYMTSQMTIGLVQYEAEQKGGVMGRDFFKISFTF